MKNDKDEELLRKLSAELGRLDAQYEDIAPPSLQGMEQFIAAEALRRQRKLRKELQMFLLVALFLLGIVLAALGFAPVLYWVLQAAFPIAALGGLAVMRIWRRREDAEE